MYHELWNCRNMEVQNHGFMVEFTELWIYHYFNNKKKPKKNHVSMYIVLRPKRRWAGWVYLIFGSDMIKLKAVQLHNLNYSSFLSLSLKDKKVSKLPAFPRIYFFYGKKSFQRIKGIGFLNPRLGDILLIMFIFAQISIHKKICVLFRPRAAIITFSGGSVH